MSSGQHLQRLRSWGVGFGNTREPRLNYGAALLAGCPLGNWHALSESVLFLAKPFQGLLWLFQAGIVGVRTRVVMEKRENFQKMLQSKFHKILVVMVKVREESRLQIGGIGWIVTLCLIKISRQNQTEVEDTICCCSVDKLCPTLCDPMDCSTSETCPPLSPGVCENSCALSRWCYSTISSSVASFYEDY